MSTLTFLHAADIHLDSPLRRLQQYDDATATRLRAATRVALANLVDLAIAENVAFVVIAGDLYDGDWDDVRTGLYFVQQMRRLKDAEIAVFAIAGNHDAATKMTYNVPLPDNVTVFGHRVAETVRLDDIGVAIHGRSFATQSVTENLAVSYPTAIPDLFNIGILHTSLDGREGHANYAPCTVSDLRHKGFDYWALGHVHTREIVNTDPWIVYPGNPQGRSIRETDERGAMLVTVDRAAGAGYAIRADFHPLDDCRWLRIEIDVSHLESRDSLIEIVRSQLIDALSRHAPRALAIRLDIVGVSAFSDDWHGNDKKWRADILAVAEGISADVTIDKVRFFTRPAHGRGDHAADDDPLAAVDEVVSQILADDRQLQELAADMGRHIGQRLPHELESATEPLRAESAEFIKQLLENCRPLLGQRLTQSRDTHTKGGK
jgi:DNA repair exonuclease SbcCD nuclease subunit